MNGNWGEKDWWDQIEGGGLSNYEELLELLMRRFQQPQMGEQAYGRAEHWAGQGLAENFWREAFHTGHPSRYNWRDEMAKKKEMVDLQKSMQQKGLSNLEGVERILNEWSPTLSKSERAKMEFQLPALSGLGQWQFGQGQDAFQNLSNIASGEMRRRDALRQGMMGASTQAGQLSSNEMFGALSGLQGFRGQDIQLLLQQLQMEMAAAQARAQAGAQQQDGCIVTSACMKARDLPDDCHELQILRKLRDWMKGNLDGGNKLVAEYEGLAPAIVKVINDRPDAKLVWNRIYDKFIKPAVDLVEQGNNGVAVKVYKDGILELAHDYL